VPSARRRASRALHIREDDDAVVLLLRRLEDGIEIRACRTHVFYQPLRDAAIESAGFSRTYEPSFVRRWADEVHQVHEFHGFLLAAVILPTGSRRRGERRSEAFFLIFWGGIRASNPILRRHKAVFYLLN
jgi:hypothetical protein